MPGKAVQPQPPSAEPAPVTIHTGPTGVESYAQRLEKPGYQYLKPFAQPVIERMRAAAEQAGDREFLEAIFWVSRGPQTGLLAPVKAASDAYHEQLGDKVLGELTAGTPRATAEAMREQLVALAVRLSAQYRDQLEDEVLLHLEVGAIQRADDATRISLLAGIAPNDWWKKALFVGAIGLGIGALGLLWRGVSAPRAARTREGAPDPVDKAEKGAGKEPDKTPDKEADKEPVAKKDDAVVEPQAQQPAAAAPIRGAINLNNDCFLHSACQMLAHSYMDVLEDDATEVAQHVAVFRVGTEPAAFAEQLAVRNASAAAIKNDLEDLERVKHLQQLVVLRRFLRLVNQAGDAIPASETAWLRTVLRNAGIVEYASRQEDASPVVQMILDRFRRGGQPAINLTEKHRLHAWQTPDQIRNARGADGEPLVVPPGPREAFVDRDDEDAVDVQNPERERESTEDSIYVSLGNFPGLVEWLRAAYGPGIVENFDANPHRRTHEWADLGPAHATVSVTSRTVSRKFVTLPPLLTVFLRRAQQNGVKDTRQFNMPEQLTLVDHPDGQPRSRHYRLETFIQHQGARTTSGHYYAHRRMPQAQGCWHTANNSRATPDAAARGDAPVEGEIQHDINHGYLYTYREVPAAPVADAQQEQAQPPPQHDGTALDPAQLLAQRPPEPPLPRAQELAKGVADDGLSRKTRAVLGPAKVRATPTPGLEDTLAKLVDGKDRSAMHEAIDAILDEQVPFVLHAYSLDLARKGAEQPVAVPLMDWGPAMRLLEQVIAWWMHFNPTLMKQPVSEVIPHLVSYVDGMVARMLADRAKVDIGVEEDDEAPRAKPAKEEPKAEAPKDDKPAVEQPKVDAPQPAKQASSEPDASMMEQYLQENAHLVDDKAGPPPEEEAIPKWIRKGDFFKPLFAAMLTKRDHPLVRNLREVVLSEKQTRPEADAARFLNGIAKDQDPPKKKLESKHDLYAIADALGLFEGKDALRAKYAEYRREAPTDEPKEPAPQQPVAQEPPKDDPKNAPKKDEPPPVLGGKPRDFFKVAQRAGWFTRRETLAATDTMGEHAFHKSMVRNLEKAKISKVRAMVESLQRAPKAGSPLAPPLSKTSLIVDTNLLDALLRPISELPPNEREVRESLEQLIEERHITDLRLTNINIGESADHGDIVGTRTFTTSKEPKRTLPFLGVPIEQDSANRRNDYQEAMLELQNASVGETKGHEDRAMVADGLFADMEHDGDLPQMATADKGVYQALMRMTDVSVDGTSQKMDPQQFAHHKSRAELVKDLAAKTGAPYFMPTARERQMIVHPIVKNAPEAEIGQPSAAGYADPLLAPCGPHTVGDLMRFINGLHYEAMIVGGAVRDLAVGKAPKDVDLKTNMPMDVFEAEIGKSERWNKVPMHRHPDMRVVQLGYEKQLVDVSCGKDGAAQGKLDVASDAASRDFRMNAMYQDIDGTRHDPLDGASDLPLTGDQRDAPPKDRKRDGRLRFAADPGPMEGSQPVSVAERVQRVVAFLKLEPWCLGRTLKFIGRGYEVDPEILDGVRDHSIEILSSIDQRENPVKARSLLLFKTDIDTPAELVALMRRFHFPPNAIQLVLPDSIAGSVAQDDHSYSRDVMPRDREKPKAPDELAGLAALKVDVVAGRIYQYRIEAEAPPLADGQKPEKLLIDIDASNHDNAGHPAPHHHIYRWVNNSGTETWDKYQAGLSRTGQPGLPRLDGNRYLGPQPWRWGARDSEGEGGDLDAVLKRTSERSGVPIRPDGEVVELGRPVQTRAHKQLLERIHKDSKLHELFVVVLNFMNGVDFDANDEQIQDFVGTYRLRFAEQMKHVEPFLESIGVASQPIFKVLDRRARLRVFDLVNANVPLDAAREAAAWSLEKATTVDEFVQRFEFHLAAMGESQTATNTREVEERWTKVIAAVQKAGSVSSGVKVPEGGDRVAAIKSIAGQLGFDTEMTAAYHVEKHLDELDAKDAADIDGAAAKYLAFAREGVANADRQDPSGEESGEQAFVFWQGSRKIVVRVTADGRAYLVTAFTKQNAEQQKVAKRPILQAVAPPKPKVVEDPKQKALERLRKVAAVGSTFEMRGIEQGYKHVAKVLSVAEAGTHGVAGPFALPEAGDPAITGDTPETFLVHGLATEKGSTSSAVTDPLDKPILVSLLGEQF